MENKVGKLVRLDEVVDVIDSLHKTPSYSEYGIPMIRVTDVKQGFLETDKTKFVSREVYEEFTKKRRPQKGDIILSRVGTYGISSYIDKEEELCLGQNTVLLFPKINSKFLYYFLQSPIAKSQIESFVTGTTQKTISLKNIKDIEIPIYDEGYTNKISEVLYDLDKKIQLNNEMNKTLEEMAQAIFKSWFIDFEPFKDGEFEESELGMIPKEWKIDTINNACDRVGSGGTPSRKKTEYYKGSNLWIKTQELNDGYIFKTSEMITDLALENSSAKLFPENTVLMAMYGATVGRLGILSKRASFNQAVCAMIANESIICYEYLYLYLLRNREYLINMAIGSAQQNLSVTTIKNYKIIIPPDYIMKKFKNIVDNFFIKLDLNRQENDELIKIRDTLLPKLISGEIQI